MDTLPEVLRHVLHYGLHFVVPGVIAYVWYKDQWKQTFLILVAVNLIDLDHLLARPILIPIAVALVFVYFIASMQ